MEKKRRWEIREEAEWKEILKAQEESHLSAVKFCRERDIDYEQFLYVRGKIRKKSSRSLVVAETSGGVPATRSRGFIPVSVVRVGNIWLRFPRGVELTSEELPPAEWVTEVTRGLVGRGE